MQMTAICWMRSYIAVNVMDIVPTMSSWQSQRTTCAPTPTSWFSYNLGSCQCHRNRQLMAKS